MVLDYKTCRYVIRITLFEIIPWTIRDRTFLIYEWNEYTLNKKVVYEVEWYQVEIHTTSESTHDLVMEPHGMM